MPLCTHEKAQKAKEQLESIGEDEYEIIEYYNSGYYYVRRKAKKGRRVIPS